MARMTRSSPWPMLTHINWLLKSRKRFPSGVQNQQPLAPATGIGSIAPCADHSKSVCFFVRSTMTWPLSPAASTVFMGSFVARPGPGTRLHRVDYRLRHVLGRRLAAEIRGARTAAREDLFDRRDDQIVAGARAEMIEHQRACPDRPDRVGDALALDVGRRPVDR